MEWTLPPHRDWAVSRFGNIQREMCVDVHFPVWDVLFLVTQERRHLNGNLILTLPLSEFSIQTLSKTCICFSFCFLATTSCFSLPYPHVKHFSRWKCSGRSSWGSVASEMPAWPWAALPAMTPSSTALPIGSAWPLAALGEPKPSRSLGSRMNPGLEFQPVGPCQATFLGNSGHEKCLNVFQSPTCPLISGFQKPAVPISVHPSFPGLS